MAKFHKSLNLTSTQRILFKESALEIMEERGLTIPSLAEKIGYSRKSVWQFFHDESIVNKYLTAAIDDYLKPNWR